MSDTPVAPERPMPANVIQAIARVMEDAPAVGKDGKFSGGGTSYNFRSIEGVTAALQKIMGRYCVVAVPKVIERVTRQFEQNAKPWTEENLTLIYTVYGPGGLEDKIEVGPLHALGRDNSDKGTNKAMSQAYKQALVQLFVIGDSKDDGDHERAEGDSHAQQMPEPPKPKAEGWATAEAEAAAHRALTEQIKQLYALIPDDAPIRAEVKAYRELNGWPMPAPSLMGLSSLVARAYAAALAVQEAKSAESQPEAAAPAPEAPSAPSGDPEMPWDNPTTVEQAAAKLAEGKPICPWCEKPVIGPKVITGGTGPDDPAQHWHKTCRDEHQGEQEA